MFASIMHDELCVFALWCRNQRVSFENYCQVLMRLKSGESFLRGKYLDDFPAFSFIRHRSTTDILVELDRIRAWREQGIEILLPVDTDFPPDFFYMSDPPRFLFFWGARQALRRPKLSVVGSREPSQFSVAWVEEEVGSTLGSLSDLVIVSGGARGIDQAAHRTALRRQRPTLIFVPSGFSSLYPANLQQWLHPVMDAGGAFLSEYLPEQKIERYHFAERNRLIAAISLATVIVEARLRSGTLLTAKAAIEQGRPVFVMPTHPYDANGKGGLNLLADGATLVRDAQDLTAFYQAELRIRNFDARYETSPSQQMNLHGL